MVTGWVLVVIPLLFAFMGYLLLRLPEINRALWQSVSLQAHLMATAAAGHDYAMAAVDAIGAALVALSLVGTLYIATGWHGALVTAAYAGRQAVPRGASMAGAAAVACATTLAAFWTVQGQFHGW